MSYPRIYSLSTVGIQKHYIHDYLFHPTRTDFIGDNGVGKSIIADLLQMLFVFDKDLIRFGTDGVKKEERQINTLPYKTKCAYCFLNLEVNKGEFITIGIQINSQKGKRIIPFVITKQADLTLSVNELSIGKEELIFAKDFLAVKESNKKEILDIQDLATFLYEEQKLRLNFFKNYDEVQSYYRFLYDKTILPLNLSLDKNLKAFAKVIQSFSKAKTLNLSGGQASKNLKEFLFEESDEDIIANFQKEQSELEKILREYESLNKDIQALFEKQRQLVNLRALEHSYKEKYESFKEAELQNTYVELKQFSEKEAVEKSLLQSQQTELQQLQIIVEKFSHEEKNIDRRYEEANENCNSFNSYEELSGSIEKLNDDINELKMLLLPKVNNEWKNNVERIDITIRDNKAIKKNIDFASLYLKKYITLTDVISARKAQTTLLDNLKSSLTKEKELKEKLLSLLLNNEKDGLLTWYIQTFPGVTAEQLQAILYFATTPVSRALNPKQSSKYIDPKILIPDFESSKVDGGIWLKLGALYEFIQFNPDANLLGNKTSLKSSVDKLIKKLKSEINEIIAKQEAVENIVDAKPYNVKLFDFSFDILIVEHSSIEELKTAVACILQIDEKITQLQVRKVKEEEELQLIKTKFNIKYNEPEIIKKELYKIRNTRNQEKKTFYENKGAKLAQLIALEKNIKIINENLQIVITNVVSKQNQFNELITSFYQNFQKNITEFSIALKDIEGLKTGYDELWEQYKATFIGTSSMFEETNNEKNPAVQLAIKDKSFSFRALEEALLGSKIKSTDDIATALHEANQTRTIIANGIRDNMVKIFSRTTERYEKYDEQVKRINTFFVERKISGKFYFKLEFNGNKEIKIDYVRQIAHEVRNTAAKGELQFGQSIVDFIEDFFRKLAKIKDRVPIDKLLNPKTYFELSAQLTDQFGMEVPGSTGETYSAIALLGIARLSAVQKEKRAGLRFIILEELGSLDNTNFNTFPAIAEEFQYQIITMAPHTFNIGFSDEWYAHHLIKGKVDEKINYHPSASYFKTTDNNEDLNIYLNRIEK